MKNCAFISCHLFDNSNNFKINKYGISLSGGGSVALSGCIGLFRALNILKLKNLYNQNALLSCTSGSSWLCSQYIFANISPDLLLGNYLEPEFCTLENLEKSNKENKFFVGNTVINSDIFKTMEKLYFEKTINSQLWIKSISETFLKLYNLDNVLIEDNKLPIKCNKILQNYKIVNSSKNRPKFPSLIINTCLNQKEYTNNGIINIYMTPNLSGFKQNIISSNTALYPILGNVLIQSFSYGCKSINKCCGNNYKKVEMPIEQPYFSLEFMTGISSYSPNLVKFIQSSSKIIPSDIDLNPKVNLWSPNNYKNIICDLADGGLNNSSGILGLLSNSVNRIFLFYTRTDGNTSNPYIIPTLQKLFGVFPENKSNENSIQVFDSINYNNIELQLKKSYESGEPTFAYMENLNVLPNKLNNIKGNFKINFLIFVTNPCPKYVNLLPKETQKAIKTLQFPFFPNYPIIFANGSNLLALSLKQINLLANYVQWCILNDPLKTLLQNLYH